MVEQCAICQISYAFFLYKHLFSTRQQLFPFASNWFTPAGCWSSFTLLAPKVSSGGYKTSALCWQNCPDSYSGLHNFDVVKIKPTFWVQQFCDSKLLLSNVECHLQILGWRLHSYLAEVDQIRPVTQEKYSRQHYFSKHLSQPFGSPNFSQQIFCSHLGETSQYFGFIFG